jgi:LPXTG-motif cell wall-anchored protein
VPKEASGSVDVTFTFDATGMEGKSVVVFEDLYLGEVNVTAHADISDEGQTIHYPDVHTIAKDAATGTHVGKAGKTDTIIDTVAYTNLVPGKEYTVKGTLMNKETGKALVIDGKEVTAEQTFTPDKADGTIEVKFAFDSSGLAGETIVVFEDIYHNGIKIGTHADISDNAQSVVYPKPIIHKAVNAVSANIPQTGDPSNIWILIAVAVAAGTALVMALRKRKKGDKEE